MLKLIRGILACLFALAMGSAQGALVDRGGGMIYDDVLDITWLQDANYLSTQFYASGGAIGDADGQLSWYDAKSWVDNLSYGGYTDWRLPRVRPVNGISFQYNTVSHDGSDDIGYNISAPNSFYAGTTASELAYMFFVNLGNKALFDPLTDAIQPDHGFLNFGPFVNVQNYIYFTETKFERFAEMAWSLDAVNGGGGGIGKGSYAYAWAVRDGDVANVPEPGTLALLALGLAALGYSRRKR